MDIGAEENAAPSSSERVLRHLETRVLDCYLSVLGRALLISTLGQRHEVAVTGVLALTPQSGFARLARVRSAEAEPEWEHVGTLEVMLDRSWLLIQRHVAHSYLDLFHERGPTRPPQNVGRVNVLEVEQIMWPSWIRAFSTPAFTDTGILEARPDGLSRPCYPCGEPPCRHRFLDVPEWQYVGSLEVELRRNWLLFDTHLADLHLDLFSERGATRPPMYFGRVYVPEVEEIMWPPWIRAFSTPASIDTGLLEAMPDGLSRSFYPCEEPPCRQRFLDVTLRTRLLQLPVAVREVLRYGCAVIAGIVVLGVALFPIILIFMRMAGVGLSYEFIFLCSCLHSRYLDKVFFRFWWLIHKLGFMLDFEYPAD